MPTEVEVKFRVADPEALTRRLRDAGFHLETQRTFERNILYDTPDRRLRAQPPSSACAGTGRGGSSLTSVSAEDNPPPPTSTRRHRTQCRTRGDRDIFTQLGFQPAFIYEKWPKPRFAIHRHCVLDHTPIGDYAELEGPLTGSTQPGTNSRRNRANFSPQLRRLFEKWVQETGSSAHNLTFDEIPRPPANSFPARADTFSERHTRAMFAAALPSPAFCPGRCRLLSSVFAPSRRRRAALWRAFRRPLDLE